MADDTLLPRTTDAISRRSGVMSMIDEGVDALRLRIWAAITEENPTALVDALTAYGGVSFKAGFKAGWEAYRDEGPTK